LAFKRASIEALKSTFWTSIGHLLEANLASTENEVIKKIGQIVSQKQYPSFVLSH